MTVLDTLRLDQLTRDGHRIGTLEAARMASLLRASVTAEARALTDELVLLTTEHEAEHGRRRRRHRPDALRSLMDTVAAFSADLIAARRNAASKGFCYRAADRAAFSATRATSRHFGKLAETWPALGALMV